MYTFGYVFLDGCISMAKNLVATDEVKVMLHMLKVAKVTILFLVKRFLKNQYCRDLHLFGI